MLNSDEQPVQCAAQTAWTESSMRYSKKIKPIGYLNTDAAGRNREALALLELLALGNQQVEQLRMKPLRDVVRRLRASKAFD